MQDFKNDSRFHDITPLSVKAFLSSPTMHGPELEYVKEAYESNWMTTIGSNIDQIEQLAAVYTGVPHAVALTCGTAAIHLAVKLAAEKLYQSSTGISTPAGRGCGGSLLGKRVFCSDLTFAATVSPVVYEGGEPVFIDSEYDTWNMDPAALEQAFRLYPDVRLVVFAHLYGTPGKIEEIKTICEEHGALLIEDAAESLGAAVRGKPAGSFGDYGIISFNGNKIITGSSGGMLLVRDGYSADKARKWSTQSREPAAWYEHEELGYNYRISNVIAGIVRGQWPYLQEHIAQKQAVYDKYAEGLKDLPLLLKPPTENSDEKANYWLSCCLIDKDAMAETARSGRRAVYHTEPGKMSPDEILEALSAFRAEGRPIWKPMHMQPIYASNSFVTKNGNGRVQRHVHTDMGEGVSIAADIFNRGFCLPSDNKLDEGQMETVIDVIHRCFQ